MALLSETQIITVSELGRNANQIVQEMKTSTPEEPVIHPISRHGKVIGVILATNPADIAARELWGKSESFVSARDFTRGNMSEVVRQVDSGEPCVVTHRGAPSILILPFEDAASEGLFDPGPTSDRRPADDFSEAELDSFS